MSEDTKTASATSKYRNEHEALVAVGNALLSLVKRDFESDAKLTLFVMKRVSGAREVLTRERATRISESEVRERIPSSKTLEMGAPRTVRMKTLDGSVVELPAGAPEEEAYHITHVSKYRMKCTCWDAVRTSSVADRRLEQLMREHNVEVASLGQVFSRYVLCKHTIATLARYVYEGEVDLNDDRLLDTLRLSLFAAYLREERNPNPEVLYNMLQKVLTRV